MLGVRHPFIELRFDETIEKGSIGEGYFFRDEWIEFPCRPDKIVSALTEPVPNNHSKERKVFAFRLMSHAHPPAFMPFSMTAVLKSSFRCLR